MNDQARALLLVGVLLSGASGAAGFVGGRVTAPVPPAEVRFVPVHVPAPAPLADAAPIEPAEAAPAAPVNEPEPAVIAPPKVEPSPLPTPRPKVEAKPQPKPEKAAAKRPRPAPAIRALPSCAAIKREYESMTWTQQMAAYRKATAQEVAYGKRCLGF